MELKDNGRKTKQVLRIAGYDGSCMRTRYPRAELRLPGHRGGRHQPVKRIIGGNLVIQSVNFQHLPQTF